MTHLNHLLRLFLSDLGLFNNTWWPNIWRSRQCVHMRDVSFTRKDIFASWVCLPSTDCGFVELWKAFTSQEQVALHQRASHCHWRTDKGNSCCLLAQRLQPLSYCVKLRGVITVSCSTCPFGDDHAGLMLHDRSLSDSLGTDIIQSWLPSSQNPNCFYIFQKVNDISENEFPI